MTALKLPGNKMEKVVSPDMMDDLYGNKVSPVEKDKEDTEKTINVEKTCLKHILFSMTVGGNYNPFKRNKFGAFITIYRIFLFLALLAFIAKTIAGFLYISKADYFGHGIVLAWNISCLMVFLLTLRMNHSSYGNQEQTFLFINTTIAPKMMKLGVKFDSISFKNKQIFLCCASAGLVIILLLFSILQVTGVLGRGNTAMMTTPFKSTPLTSFIQIVLIAVCALQSNIPSFYMIVVCYMLTHYFRGLKAHLHEEMCKDACRLPHTIQKIREFYTDLCKVVKDFDKDFQYLLGNLFFWNIIISLFTLYVLLRSDKGIYDPITIMAYIFWVFLSMSTLVTVSVFAALVHEAVRFFQFLRLKYYNPNHNNAKLKRKCIEDCITKFKFLYILSCIKK